MPKISRVGASLWFEWEGEDFFPERTDTFIFYTFEHIDVNDDIIQRALASHIQRLGLVDQLGQAFDSISRGAVTHGWMGQIDGSYEYHACTEDGDTVYGEEVDEVLPATFIEVRLGNN